jgi:hypothetical protein
LVYKASTFTINQILIMKTFSLLLIIIFSSAKVFTQHIRLNAYGNYVFDDKVEFYNTSTNYFTGTVQGGLLWGAGLEMQLHDYYSIEVLYLRQDTKAPVQFYDINSFSEREGTVDLDINWIVAGAMRAQSPNNKKIEPYAGALLGVAIIKAENPEKNVTANATKFAWGLRLGSNFWISESLGIKVQAQLLSAVQAAGGSFYFGTGGSGTNVTGYSTMTQFALGGGLVYKLGPKTAKSK